MSRLRDLLPSLPRLDDGGVDDDEDYWDEWELEKHRAIRDALVEIEEADDLEEAQNEARLLREDIEGVISGLERINDGEHPCLPTDWGETDD